MASEGIVSFDAKGRIDFINDKGAAILGYGSGKIPGMVVHQLFLRDPSDLLSARSDHKNVHMRKKDGSVVEVDAHVTPLQDNGSNAGGIILFSKTEKGNGTDPGQRSKDGWNERLIAYIENSPVALLEWNSELVVTGWAGKAEKMFGYKAEEVIGRSIVDLNIIHPDDIPIVKKAVKRLTENGDLVVVSSNRNITKDGRVIHVNWYNTALYQDGKMSSVMSFALDETTRTEAEIALKESEQRLRTVLENSLDGINMLDLRTGRYVVLSPAQVTMTGLTLEQLQGMTAEEAYERTHPDDRHITIEQQKRVREGKDSGEPVVYRWLVNGEYRWFSDRRKIVLDDKGKPVAMVGISRDITDRKRIEEGLKEAQKSAEEVRDFLETVIANSPEGVAVFDADLHLKLANEYYRKNILDEPYRDADIIGLRIDEFIPGVVDSRIPDIIREVARTGRPAYEKEAEFRGFDRGVTYWNFACVPIGPASHRDVLVTLVDVTDHVEAKRRIEEERARLEAVLEQMPLAVIIADTNGKLVMGNNAVETIFRYPMLPSSTIKEYSEWKAYHPNDMSELRAEEHAMAKALITGRPVGTEEVVIKRGDGSMGTVISSAAPFRDSKGNMLGAVAIAWDITDRKVMEKEIRDARDRLETILGNLPVAVIVVEPPAARIVYYNAEVENQYRRDLSSVENYDDLVLRHPSYHLDGKEYALSDYPVFRALRTGMGVYSEILEFERADGTRGFVNANAVPVMDEMGNVTSVIGLRFDVTTQIEAQKALARSNADLQQFAYVASHDLQEPLRMVMSYTSLLVKKHGSEMTEEALDYAQHIITGAERMRELINDLLQYSRIDSRIKPFTMVDLNRVIGSLLEVMKVAITDSGAEVTVETLPTVFGDESQLSQVLQNLLSNAIKFRSQERPRITISSYTRPREWVISVKDNGIGIDPKYSDRLFQMFQRLHTRDEYPGTGIGLVMSKKIVERHGGQIWFESVPYQGTTFYFSLPKTRSTVQEKL